MTDDPTMDQPQAMAAHLLLLCARCSFDDSVRAEAAALLRRDVDWDHLLALGRRHYLLPLVHHRLSDLGSDALPPTVASQLKSVYFTSLLRSRRLLGELGQVVDALQRAGVDVLVLKGGALAPTAYDSPALRPMTDLDLLVRAGQVGCASAALEDLGFRRGASLPDSMLPFQQRLGGGVEWQRDCDGHITRVDLQHDLVGVDWCRTAFPVQGEALWHAARPFMLDGTPARQLSPEDTLIHLCLHPALHHGYASPLIGYVDMGRVMAAAGGEAFWPSLVRRVTLFRVRAVVYHGLLAARDLVGAPVPDETLAALAPGPARARLLRRLAPMDPGAALQGVERQPTGLHQALLYLVLADGPRAAAAIVRDVALPGDEWLTARYSPDGGGPTWPHRLAHPFRVGRALLRSLRRPLRQSGLD